GARARQRGRACGARAERSGRGSRSGRRGLLDQFGPGAQRCWPHRSPELYSARPLDGAAPPAHRRLAVRGELTTMTRVDDVIRWLDAFAPPRLAEGWDNVGLLWGDPRSELGKIMTCLTVTSATADEAIAAAAGLIVSHHPVLFRGAKRVTADDPVTGMLWRL